MELKLHRLVVDAGLTAPEGASVLCVAGAGETASHAPADSWLWAVNPRMGHGLPRNPDVVFGADPVYWTQHNWRHLEPMLAAVVCPDDCGPVGYAGQIHRYRCRSVRYGRNPHVRIAGSANWSAAAALLVAMSVWRGAIVLCGIDLSEPKYDRQRSYWRKLFGVLPDRVYRMPGTCHRNLWGLPEWEPTP